MNVLMFPRKPKALFSERIAVDGDTEGEGERAIVVTIDDDCAGLAKIEFTDGFPFEMLNATEAEALALRCSRRSTASTVTMPRRGKPLPGRDARAPALRRPSGAVSRDTGANR